MSEARQNMMRYMTKMTDNLIAGIVALFVKIIFPFCFPIKGFLLFTFCVVICDTITGIIAAKKRKEEITSYGLRRTTEKIVVYFIAILLGEGIRVTFFKELDIAYAVAVVIALTEFKSNIENVESITNVKIWIALKEKFVNLKS